MRMESEYRLVRTAKLSEEQSTRLTALSADCERLDGIPMDLYLESASDADIVNQILCYHNETLVGIASLSADESIELQLAVHPAHRRRGIAHALTEAARAEAARRGIPNVLLVCDDASASGAAFAEAIGAVHAYSEYRMRFDPSAPSDNGRTIQPENAIRLRRIEPQDIEVLINLSAEAREKPTDAMRERFAAWLAEPSQRFYVGMLPEGTAVGMLRVAEFEEDVYINTFSVLPERRHRGYGRQMLTGIVRLLSEEGKPVRLEVAAQNETALSLYLSCGFKKEGAYRYYALSG